MLAVRPWPLLVPGLLLSFSAPYARAWDYFGHHVVGAIAWEETDDATRRAAVDLLLEAPADSDLPDLLPKGPRPFALRARELFLKAQGWADLVRDELFAARKERYDRPSWHYVNRFWTPGPLGPRWLLERGVAGDLVRELEAARRRMSDDGLPRPERALALAWVLHLAGDVHQPLHSSSRVTELDPEGDRGGNDFALDDPESSNLHALWDSILSRARRHRHSESYFGRVGRVARELQSLHPRESLREEIANQDVEDWSKAAAAIAMRSAYPDRLVRGAAPPRSYGEDVFEIAARQAALAGYRLAHLLEEAGSR